MAWTIHITTPNADLAVYALEIGRKVVIGRESGDIRVHDESVSTTHVRLVCKKREVLFEDLQSTNGTYHRSQRKSFGVILPGDDLFIGETKIHFELATK